MLSRAPAPPLDVAEEARLADARREAGRRARVAATIAARLGGGAAAPAAPPAPPPPPPPPPPDLFARLTETGRAAIAPGATAWNWPPGLAHAAAATLEVRRSLRDPQQAWARAAVAAGVRRGLAPPSSSQETAQRRRIWTALSSLELGRLPAGHDARLLWLVLDSGAARQLGPTAPERERVRARPGPAPGGAPPPTPAVLPSRHRSRSASPTPPQAQRLLDAGPGLRAERARLEAARPAHLAALQARTLEQFPFGGVEAAAAVDRYILELVVLYYLMLCVGGLTWWGETALLPPGQHGMDARRHVYKVTQSKLHTCTWLPLSFGPVVLACRRARARCGWCSRASTGSWAGRCRSASRCAMAPSSCRCTRSIGTSSRILSMCASK
jgi:hypothetical protein